MSTQTEVQAAEAEVVRAEAAIDKARTKANEARAKAKAAEEAERARVDRGTAVWWSQWLDEHADADDLRGRKQVEEDAWAAFVDAVENQGDTVAAWLDYQTEITRTIDQLHTVETARRAGPMRQYLELEQWVQAWNRKLNEVRPYPKMLADHNRAMNEHTAGYPTPTKRNSDAAHVVYAEDVMKKPHVPTRVPMSEERARRSNAPDYVTAIGKALDATLAKRHKAITDDRAAQLRDFLDGYEVTAEE